jgi:hypothetical protein
MANKSATKAPKRNDPANRNHSRESQVRRDSATGKFIAADTGRVIKSSPAKPRLGKELIQTAVRSYVRRDAKTGKISN